MFQYLKNSFSRKIARRFTKQYPAHISEFNIQDFGKFELANWTNPLVPQYEITHDMLLFFKEFIKKGDLIIDIGANIGDLTVPMAILAGQEGITLAFDPNPFVFDILLKNAALNKNTTNIIPLQFAITEKEEDFFYISSEASFSNGGLSKTKKSIHGKYVYPDIVKSINLETFITKNYAVKLNNLSFIKVDAEGYDKEIIKSIKPLISKIKPVLVAESFGKATNYAKLDLYNTIEDLGYSIYYMEDFSIDAERIHLQKPQDILKWGETINILALPN